MQYGNIKTGFLMRIVSHAGYSEVFHLWAFLSSWTETDGTSLMS